MYVAMTTGQSSKLWSKTSTSLTSVQNWYYDPMQKNDCSHCYFIGHPCRKLQLAIL